MKNLTFVHLNRSVVIKLMLLVSCLVLKYGCSLSDESSDQHLAPHEVKLYEAFNNIHLDDAAELKSLHVDDARIELACGKDQVRIGSFQDVFGKIQSKVELVKTKIEPITTTNDVFPERGIFSFHWFTFMKTKDNCTGMFSGFATVKFDDNGLVTTHKRFSNDCKEIMECIFGEDFSQFQNTGNSVLDL